MTRFNLQSLGFATLVLVLGLLGKQGSGEAGFPVTSSVETTSLTAEAFRSEESEIPSPAANFSSGAAAARTKNRIIFDARPDTGRVLISTPKIQAKAAVVSEVGRPVPLFAEGYRNRWPIASLTKLMSAVVVLEGMDPARTVVISETAAASFGDVGTFRPGETFTVADLLRAMLVGSANDAAVALAESYGYDHFLEAMRAKAFAIGMAETTFADPTGISVLNQSTAEDLTKLADFIAEKHRAIFTLTSLKGTAIIERNSGNSRNVPATNLFAGNPDFVGGKTGYTSDAIGNLLSVFSDGKREFIVIVLGTSDRFGTTEDLWAWTKKTKSF